MNIPLIRIYELADLLEKDGQIRIIPKNDKLVIEIYENPEAEGNVTVLIPGVIQRPSIGINLPDDFFKELQKEIEHHLPKIKKLVFQDGGIITIPEVFRKWCKEHGIVIKALNEVLKKYQTLNGLRGSAKDTWSDIID